MSVAIGPVRLRRCVAVATVLLAISMAVGSSSAIAAGPADPGVGLRGSGRETSQVLRGSLRMLASGGRPASERGAALARLVTTGEHHDTRVAVTVELDGPADDRILAQLAGAGARVLNVRSGTVEASVAPEALQAVADLAGVESVRPILRHLASATSVGVSLQGATDWQSAGFTGTGVKVGIIDGGFSGLPERVGNELPAIVHARCYGFVGTFTSQLSACANGETHGTAVAETIADMAPDIELFIANPISTLDVLGTIAWMTTSGVKVINASWSSGFVFEGPGDGTSPYQFSSYSFVDRAVAGGALWVNAAGNAGDTGWTGAWTDMDGDRILDWAAGDERNSVSLRARQAVVVAIRWADPWGASANDYALELLSGTSVVASSNDPQSGTGDPYEVIEFVAPTAGTYDISVRHVTGAPTPRLQMLAYTGARADLRYRVAAGTLPSPADSANPGMVTVGAVNVATPDTIEPYSSQGPTLDGRIKPDLVAVDCAPTSIVLLFCGTSEAAPFVAGAAALHLQANPSLVPTQLADRLRSRAVGLGSPVPNATSGWGRLALGPVPTTAAVGLAFAAPTTGAVVGAPLTGQPAIRIVDAAGATVSSGPSSAATVTIGLVPGTGASLSCDGGLSRRALEGVAYFSGCAIDRVGSGYAIEARTIGLAPVVSPAIEILPAGSMMPLVISAATSSATWADDVLVSGRLGSSGTAAGATRLVELERSLDGLRWTRIAAGTTDQDGAVSWSTRAVTTARYRVRFDGSEDLPAAMSYPVRLTVRQKLTFSASLPGPRAIAAGQKVTFSSTVRPRPSDMVRGKVTFVVYRRVGGSWALFRQTDVALDADGRARFTWRFSKAGSWYVRARAPATSTNAASTWSPLTRYVVR